MSCRGLMNIGCLFILASAFLILSSFPQVLDRCLSSPLVDVTQEGYYTDPSGADLHSTAHQVVGNRSTAHCVRDVSWHPYKPEMMSSAWDPSFGGTVAKHEWKGYGKHGVRLLSFGVFSFCPAV